MELQPLLAFALFIPLLLFFKLVLAVDPFPSSPLSPPSPSPSPSPTFAPRMLPSDHVPHIVTPSPRRPPQASNGSQERTTAGQTPEIDHLNLGEKVGLSFLAVAVGLQVVLGVFLVCTRIQLRKMEWGNLSKAEPSHPSSP
ncbi:hypothetical protein ZIOFF_023049 [Zingiber officinale]|uniref:Uncharacterized protein n=1 Tax=Zingiber officinale TaxID=94328 RepID=A0A8J5HAL6_ZINOF|nr:hypothetical protein ZIOFF_023049 [Zingiber officinale]